MNTGSRAFRDFVFIIFLWVFCLPVSYAISAEEIDAEVDAALERFASEVEQADELRKKATGILVIPNVIQAGAGIGGEYGNGALLINNNTVSYYRMISASFGFQLGGQVKDIIMLFMQQTALDNFRESAGWTVGVDGSVVLVEIGVEGRVDIGTLTKEPILGFVIGQRGLMFNLSLEGSKFTRLALEEEPEPGI